MISNSCMQITLLSFLFKKINIKDTLKLYAVLFSMFHIRQRGRVLKQL
jgi:hypothetical protein